MTCLEYRRPRKHTYKAMYNAKAYSAASATSSLISTTITRRNPTEHDIQIEILFCGICHSDLHQVRNEWSGVMPTVYPCVPGHEIVGRVTNVGSAVTKFKPGHLAAVGCIVHLGNGIAEWNQHVGYGYITTLRRCYEWEAGKSKKPV